MDRTIGNIFIDTETSLSVFRKIIPDITDHTKGVLLSTDNTGRIGHVFLAIVD